MLEDYFKNPDNYEFCTEDFGWPGKDTLNDTIKRMRHWGWFLFGSAVPKFDGIIQGYTATFIRKKK